jgi:hypothetical protein
MAGPFMGMGQVQDLQRYLDAETTSKKEFMEYAGFLFDNVRVGTPREAFNGSKTETAKGWKKEHMTRRDNGKIVIKALSDNAREGPRTGSKHVWIKAVGKARVELRAHNDPVGHLKKSGLFHALSHSHMPIRVRFL